MRTLLFVSACLLGLLKNGDSQAHQVWADGTRVPQWVKRFCSAWPMRINRAGETAARPNSLAGADRTTNPPY
jgi:hypothetical protein